MTAEVNLEELVDAMDFQTHDTYQYFDTLTGKFEMFSQEELNAAEKGDDPEDHPDWQQETINLAIAVVEDNTGRFLEIPSQFDIHEYQIMEDFCRSVTDPQPANDLAYAIRGRGAFRRFKDKLDQHSLTDQWHKFRHTALIEIGRAWCAQHYLPIAGQNQPPRMAPQPWLPTASNTYIQSLAQLYAATDLLTLETELDRLIAENRTIHEEQCLNLNPATNVMNPKAEAMLAQRLGSRPSLGYPGEKYEMGLEAIEKIEVMAAELACQMFNAPYAEIRVPSGAMANLYAFMATCQPGDRIVVPSDAMGGHITHHRPGAAGLYGLESHPAPIDPENFTVAVDALRRQVKELRPKLITIGGSLNLFPHPVAEIRAIADEVGARVLFDAAHLSGIIAGGVWPNPLDEGAHLMTMSTYKSLGGPPSGLIVTNEPALAERLNQIAFPGLTANFDVAKSASLVMTLLDWKAAGSAYAAEMAETARALAEALAAEGLPVFAANRGFTQSHQFAVEAAVYGGGQTAARLLRRANILTCGIGLPLDPVQGDLNGLRLGTPEIVRWGFRPENMRKVAGFISRVLVQGEAPETVAPDVTGYRQKFQQLHFIRS